MKILITGDLVVSKDYDPTRLIDQEVISMFKSSDYNIVNLEAPVTNSQSKINKTGPHIKSDRSSTMDVLSVLKINLTTLANNHILDYNEQGVMETLTFCNEQNISTLGAGKNKDEAGQTHYIESPNGRIGVINIAENEWASATQTSAGANGMDIIDDVHAIQETRKNCDFVVVIVHGGHEYYNLPSPRMQKQYRFYVDNGADLVVGHHTHCLSGMEVYKNKEIYYSLGNFLFTKPSEFQDWYTGIVLQIDVSEQKEIQTTPIFVKQSKEDFSLSMIEGREHDEIHERFSAYSKLIANEASLDSAWQKYILEKRKQYENYWSPLSFIKNKYLKYVFTKMRIDKINSAKGRSLFLNLLRCEAHADLSKEVLKESLKK
jgi:poly-gamma-glutamate synthesis protein (capsule biosynthesis protein)